MATRNSLRRRRRTASIFEETEVLADMLEDLTHMYAGERQVVSVNTGKRSAMDMDTSYHVTTDIRDEIGRVLSGPNKLRYIVDDLAHAIEHDNVTDFDLLQRTVQQYDDSEATIVIAATVVTMLEDQFVDTNRVNRHRGHRRRVAFKHAIQMRGSLRPPLEDLNYEAVPMEAFIQLATAGYIKDPDSVDRRRKLLFRWMREKIQTARTERDAEKRMEIATSIIDQLLRMTKTNHTAAQNHVFNYPPPTHDLDAMLTRFNVDQTTDGSDMMNKLKSRFNRAKQKAKQKRNGGDPPDELPDDFDPDDFDMDEDANEDANEDAPSHADGNHDEVDREDDSDDGTGGSSSGDSAQREQAGETETTSTGGRSQETDDEAEADDTAAGGGQQGDTEQDETPSAQGTGKPDDDGDDEVVAEDGDEAGGLGEQGDDEDFSDMGAGDATSQDDQETVSRSNDDPLGHQGRQQQQLDEETNEDAQRGSSEPVQGGEDTASVDDALQAGDVGEWYSAGEKEEYINPSDNAKERFKSLKRAVVKRQMGDLNERRRERDDRADSNNGVDFDVESEVEQRGLAEEVAREFRKIKTRDRNVRDTKGRRLEMRQAQRNIAGNPSIQDVWLRRKRAEVGDRAIGVAVDLSGSMDAQETMVALGTLSKAVDIIGDDLVITTFHRRGASLVTGPNEPFRWEHLNAARAGGKTPTAHGILDGQLLLDECSKREKVLFVLTDGRPNVSLEETGASALEDAKAQIKDARRDDVKVIGLGLSSVDESQMKAMFGQNNYIMVDERTLAQDLIDVYQAQLSVEV